LAASRTGGLSGSTSERVRTRIGSLKRLAVWRGVGFKDKEGQKEDGENE
jgi:hypothetical protein